MEPRFQGSVPSFCGQSRHLTVLETMVERTRCAGKRKRWKLNMRVYHFVPAGFGLEDLRHRRLKIATINELNDPFELLAINLEDPGLRRAFTAVKKLLATTSGMLCFSRRWRNPVQWSHYAENHRGLCLGFDVPDECLTPVQYTGRRLALEAEQLLNSRDMDQDLALKFISTKFSHWKYEAEVRAFLSLDDRDPDTGFYFAKLSKNLELKEVIVGARSSVSRSDVSSALGSIASEVQTTKARLAFKSFSVVAQRDGRLWR